MKPLTNLCLADGFISLLNRFEEFRPMTSLSPSLIRFLFGVAVLAVITHPLSTRADFISDPSKILQGADNLKKADSPLERTLHEVVSQMQLHCYDRAVAMLKPLAAQNPSDERIWFLLAVAYYEQNQLSEALAAASRCVEVKPRWQQGYWLKAIVLTAQTDLAQAGRTYDRAVEVAPSEPGGYLQRGQFLVQYRPKDRGQLLAATEDLKKALKVGAPAETAHGFLGLAYRRLGNLEQAEYHYRQVLERSPNQLDAVKELVSLYEELKQNQKAEQLLVGVRKSSSSLTSAQSAALSLIEARHAIATGAALQAVDGHFQAALTKWPGDVAGRREYTRWLEATERIPEAIRVLREGLGRTPGDPDLAAHLAWVLAEAGQDLDQARHCLEVARRRNPNSPYLADTEAWIEYRAGNYRAALAAIQPSLTLAEEVPEIAFHAGAIHAKLGNSTTAAQFVRTSLLSGRPFTGKTEAEALSHALSGGISDANSQVQQPSAQVSGTLTTIPRLLALGFVCSGLAVLAGYAWRHWKRAWRKCPAVVNPLQRDRNCVKKT